MNTPSHFSWLKKIRTVLTTGSFLCFLGATPLLAWTETRETVPSPPQEFRGAWVASIYNIDWPTSSSMSAEAQRQELVALVNKAHSLHLNAIIFQVRSKIFASKYDFSAVTSVVCSLWLKRHALSEKIISPINKTLQILYFILEHHLINIVKNTY